jgi:hypothetical protein
MVGVQDDNVVVILRREAQKDLASSKVTPRSNTATSLTMPDEPTRSDTARLLADTSKDRPRSPCYLKKSRIDLRFTGAGSTASSGSPLTNLRGLVMLKTSTACSLNHSPSDAMPSVRIGARP